MSDSVGMIFKNGVLLAGSGGAGSSDAVTLNGQTGNYYRDRANHTGTQAIETITDLATELSGKAPAAALYAVVAENAYLENEVLISVINGYGLLSARPLATASPGFFYYATDNNTLYRSNGTAWSVLTIDWANLTGMPDLATQAELDTHKASSDHDGRYYTEAESNALLAAKQDTAAKNTAGGYAGLDNAGKINPAQIPAIALVNTSVVASEAAMLGLVAETGDVCVRLDLSKSFILKGTNPAVLSDWQELLTPTDAVNTVFGRSGTVTAQAGDYTGEQVTNTPSGNVAAVTVQGAINELDAEKASQVALDAEIANRTAADNTLQTNINAKVSKTTRRTVGIEIMGANGGADAIVAGLLNVYITVSFTGVIKKWRLLSLDGTSGSIVIDVHKDTYANYPPTAVDTITAADKPTITTAVKAEGTALTGWTTAVAAGDILGFEVETSAALKNVRLELELEVNE